MLLTVFKLCDGLDQGTGGTSEHAGGHFLPHPDTTSFSAPCSCISLLSENLQRTQKLQIFLLIKIYINYLETGFLRVPGHWRYPNRLFVSPNLFKPSDSLISTPLIWHTIFYLEPKQHPLWTYSKPLAWPWLQLFWPCIMWDLLFVPHHDNRKGTFGQYRPTLAQ